MDRIGYVGASDVAPILGESNFSSQVDVWKVKTGRKPSFEGNEATEWGTRLEKDVAKKFEDNHPEFEDNDFINNHKILNEFHQYLDYGHKDVSADVEVHKLDGYENVKWLKIKNFIQEIYE